MHSQSNFGVRIFIGLLMILFGVSFLFNQFGISFPLSKFWPIILIALGGFMIYQKRSAAGIILSAIGLVFLGSAFFSFNAFSLFWPLLIIGVGVALLFKPNFFSGMNESGITTEDTFTASTIFGGLKRKIVSKAFKSGRFTTLFGGTEIDLRDAIVADNAEIVIDSLFGGVEIIVPEGMNVVSDGAALFGAWENNTDVYEKPVSTLKVTGSVLFGGVEIKVKK